MKITKTILTLFIFLSLFSCSDNNDNKKETINDNLTNLLLRMSANDTSNDTTLNANACFEIVLPVTVITNGQQLQINTEADYQLIQDANNASDDDDDSIDFIYPINIQFQNYQMQQINNLQELAVAYNTCSSMEMDILDCIDIVYPISLNTYDENSTLVNTNTIQNDQELYTFFSLVQPNNIIEFDYPFSLTNTNGETFSVNSNEELETVLENAVANCN